MKGLICALIAVVGSTVLQGDRSYSADDFGTMSVAGVCSVDTENVKCWDSDGKPNPKVQELVMSYFIANPNNELRVRFRKRNRLVVLSYIARRGALTSLGGDITTTQGIRSSSSGQIGHEQGQEGFRMYWIYPSESEKTTDLTVSLHVRTKVTPSIEVKEGATVKIGTGTLKITGISPVSKEQAMQLGMQAKWWRISYEITGQTLGQEVSIYPSAVDRKGAPINNVDKEGNPDSRPSQFGDGHFVQILGPGYMESGMPVWQSRVRPDKIGRIYLSTSSQREVILKNIALDPAE